VAECAVDELPSYVPEPPPPRPPRPPRPVAPRRPGEPVQRHSMLVVWRVVELEPPRSVEALADWYRRREGSDLVVRRRRFHLDGPARWASMGAGWRIRARVRRCWGVRRVRLELELLPWSDGRTELDLRPRGAAARLLQASCNGHYVPTRWANRYFDAAHAMVDELRDSLLRLASDRAPTSDRTAATTKGVV
jgi:hypothetical protein